MSKQDKSSTSPVKTTLRLPPDLYWRFQEAQARRRVNNQTAICQAIERWIEEPAAHNATSSDETKNEWAKRLQRVLESGNHQAVEAIQQQLLFFVDFIEHFAANPRRHAKRESA